MRFGSECSVVFSLFTLCSCMAIGHHKHPKFPAPPSQSTQSPEQFFDMVNEFLNNFEEHDDGMTWYFGDEGTPPPAPEIPDLPEPHEDRAELPKFFPTFNPKFQWDMTIKPTVYIDNNYYNNPVTSSSFIAVAIAIVVILILSMIVTIYAIKARKRGVLIMTVRRSLQRNADVYPNVTDSDHSLLVRPAPIVYVEGSHIGTLPSSGGIEPPPYSEHQEVLLPPTESPPPYTEVLNANCSIQCDSPQTVTNSFTNTGGMTHM